MIISVRVETTDWRDELLSVRDAHLKSALTIEGSVEGRTVTARSSALEICARGLCDMLRQQLGPEIILAIAKYERVGLSVGDGRKGYLARDSRVGRSIRRIRDERDRRSCVRDRFQCGMPGDRQVD